MIKWRPGRSASGKVMIMITRWESSKGVIWDAEVYPNNGEIVAEAKTLDILLNRLKKETAQKSINSRI